MDIREAGKDLIIAVVAGLVSVLATIHFTPDWEVTAREKGWVSMIEWKQEASKKGWIELEQCPAYPISIELSSPGTNSTVPFDDYSSSGAGTRIETKFVVKSSRPVPENGKIGVIFSPDDKSDVYVVFPFWSSSPDNKIFSNNSISLPIKLKNSKSAEIHSFFTSNQSLFGEVYSSLEQVTKEDPEIVLSEKTTLSLRREE